MKALLLLLVCVVTAVAQQQQQTGNVLLRDGTDLPSSKIIAIGEKSVTVMAAGKISNYPIEEVSEISLQNARELLSLNDDKKKAALDSAMKRDAELKAEREAEKKLAASNSAKKKQGKATDTSRKPVGKDPIKTLLELKTRFPRQEILVLDFFNVQRGQYQKPMKMEVRVPHNDVYSDYQGWIRTVTLDGIPQTLVRIEERIKKNESATSKMEYDPNDSASVQAQLTSEWVQNKLRPYLAELRALNRN
jgi:hypothetical protein